ncbi:hypothetical protein [Micromonospora fulviviridis]
MRRSPQWPSFVVFAVIVAVLARRAAAEADRWAAEELATEVAG